MRIAVYGRSFEQDFIPCITDLFGKLKRHGIELFVYTPFSQFLRKEAGIEPWWSGLFEDASLIPRDLDYFFSIGGDGTFLETVTYVRDSKIPIVGINSGRLGFLASIAREELNESLDTIFSRQYSLEERTLLQLECSGNPFGDFSYALNEVTIQKKGSTMITIHTHVDNELLNAYWADGLIISTPTGSTAYSLSVGGPIVTPSSKNFIISPIAPHNLTMRPVVIPDDKTLRFRVDGRISTFLVTVDSRSAELRNSTEIILKLADFRIHTLKLDTHDYYSTLRSKLMWGADKRN